MDVVVVVVTVTVGVVFVPDRINSVGDYNSPPGGCRLSVCVCLCVCVPTFFHVSRLDNF